jgi:hypothetical protein
MSTEQAGMLIFFLKQANCFIINYQNLVNAIYLDIVDIEIG